MAILIKNGTLITASETFDSDLLIEGEAIAEVGKHLQYPNAEVIDAAGKLVLPGGIDPHVHLDLPMFGTVSSDDHYTGHKAAAFGGTTTVMDFVVLEPEGFQRSVDLWFQKSAKAAIDYSFHMNLTRFDSKIAAEIPWLEEMTTASTAAQMDAAPLMPHSQAIRLGRRVSAIFIAIGNAMPMK